MGRAATAMATSRGGGGGPARDPSAFEWTDHAEERLGDPMRFADERMVNEAIRNGRRYTEEGGPGRERRRARFSGVDCCVVVDNDARTVVTLWTEVGSFARAMASDRWSMDDIEKINAFEDRRHKRWGTSG